MRKFMKALGRIRMDEEGVTLVEYGIAIVLGVTVGTAALLGLAESIEGEMDGACQVMSSSDC